MKERSVKNIISLPSDEARKFLLKEESYFTFDLPIYFTFGNILNSISQELNGSELSNYYKPSPLGNGSLKPRDFEDVNYELMNNKNGKYAWRLFQLIHPAIYVSLVHKITSNGNWQTIQNRFNKKSSVECMSIPVVSQSTESDKAELITHWWEEIEQKSIALALEYEHIFHTDISDCYGSLYTHSVAWALHTKPVAKQNRQDTTMCGNIIDFHLQSMSYGQTNGIPQGSVLMDLIAEMVLSYADELLANKLQDMKEEDYKILRYRDDYRIFVNNPQKGEEIIKHLTGILAGLGMQLSSQKTRCSNDVIHDSIKPDKYFTIVSGKTSDDMQKELFILKDLAKQHPNSGSLSKKLKSLHEAILKRDTTKYDPEVLASIITDLAFHNPRTYPIASAVLSKMINYISDEGVRKNIILKIINKFKIIPNTEHMDLWLQRITLKMFSDITYEGRLCKRVCGDTSVSIWNSDWLNGKLEEIMSSANIIDVDKIEKLDSVIKSEEVSLFKQEGYY